MNNESYGQSEMSFERCCRVDLRTTAWDHVVQARMMVEPLRMGSCCERNVFLSSLFFLQLFWVIRLLVGMPLRVCRDTIRGPIVIDDHTQVYLTS